MKLTKNRRVSLPASHSTPSLSSPLISDTSNMSASVSTTDFGRLLPPATHLSSIPEGDRGGPSRGRTEQENGKEKDKGKAKKKDRMSLGHSASVLPGVIGRIKSLRGRSRTRHFTSMSESLPQPHTTSESEKDVGGIRTEDWGTAELRPRLLPTVLAPAIHSPMSPLPPLVNTVPDPSTFVFCPPDRAVSSSPHTSTSSSHTQPHSPTLPAMPLTRGRLNAQITQSDHGPHEQTVGPPHNERQLALPPIPPPRPPSSNFRPHDMPKRSPSGSRHTSVSMMHPTTRRTSLSSTTPSEASHGSNESLQPLIGSFATSQTIFPSSSQAASGRKLISMPPAQSNQGFKLTEHHSSPGESSRTSSETRYPQIFTVHINNNGPPLSIQNYDIPLLTLVQEAEPPVSSPLNRNPSTSTNASTVDQRTDESGMVQTPRDLDQGQMELSPDVLSDSLKKSQELSWKEFRDSLHGDVASSIGIGESRSQSPSSEATSQVHSVSSASTARPFLQHRSSIPILGRDPESKGGRDEGEATKPSAQKVRPVSISFDTATPATLRARSEFQDPSPRLVRMRSSSVETHNTNSVYSIGEIKVATTGVVSSARTVHFDLQRRVEDDLAREAAKAVAKSSAAIKKVFEDSQTPWETIKAERYRTTDWANDIRRAAPEPPRLNRRSSSPVIVLPKQEIANTRRIKSRPPSPAAQTAPRGPMIPYRSSSLGRLWRKLSSSSRRSSIRHGGEAIDDEPVVVSPTKKRSISLDPVEYIIPDVPSPALPKHRKEQLLQMSNSEARRHKSSNPAKLKGKEPEEVPVPPARSSSLMYSRRSSLPPTASSQSPGSSPTSNRIPDSSATYQPASFASKSLIELRTSVPTRSPTLSYRTNPPCQRRELRPGTTSSPSSFNCHDTSSPRDFTEKAVDETQTTILYAQTQSREAKRRYRQSLVDIQDDWVFQREARNLVKLESTDLPEWQGRHEGSGDGVGAWFVTRELVQGERRHGRILAKGVEMVRAAAAAASVRDDVPASRIESSVSKNSIRLRRERTAPGSSRARSEERYVTSRSEETSVIPLDILLFRLPRLLALSLKLSTRFDHDPSPAGVAAAFSEMESRLTSEVALWAGEIGGVVTTGLGHAIGRSIQSGRANRTDHRSDDRDDRLILADIIITPIQRAARYKLLFQEMIDQLPDYPTVRRPIEEAIRAADRLAAECNRRQSLNLDLFRRSALVHQGQKGKRVRPKSLGNIGSIGGRNWFNE